MTKIINAMRPSGPNINLNIKLVIAPIMLKINPNNEMKMITPRIINSIAAGLMTISSI